MSYTRLHTLWLNDLIGGTKLNKDAIQHFEDAFASQDTRIAVIEGLPQAKGDLFIASAAGVFSRLPISATIGQVLTVNPGAALGADWETPPGGTTSPITTAGDLIVGNTSGIAARFPKSAILGSVLTVTSTGAGVNWRTPFYQTIQDEGLALTQQTTLNFKGSAVTAVNNPATNVTDVTILAGSGIVNWASGTVDTSNGFADAVSIPAGSKVFRLISKRTYFGVMNGNATEYNQTDLCIVQDAVGGNQVSITPNTIFWKGVAVDAFNNPTIDLTANSITHIRLTWLDTNQGWIGEI